MALGISGPRAWCLPRRLPRGANLDASPRTKQQLLFATVGGSCHVNQAIGIAQPFPHRAGLTCLQLPQRPPRTRPSCIMQQRNASGPPKSFAGERLRALKRIEKQHQDFESPRMFYIINFVPKLLQRWH